MSDALNEVRRTLGLSTGASTSGLQSRTGADRPSAASVSLRQVKQAGTLGTDRLSGEQRVAVAVLAVLAVLHAAFDQPLVNVLVDHSAFGSAHLALQVLTWPAPHAQQVLSGVGALLLTASAGLSRAYTALGDVAGYLLLAGLITAITGTMVAFLIAAATGVAIVAFVALGAVVIVLVAWALLAALCE